jgi:site-specific recombinase XerD
MEKDGAESIEDMTVKKVERFFEALAKRKGKTTGQVLSQATLRDYLTVLNRFAKYLRKTEQGNLEIGVSFRGREQKAITILSKAEIEKLYQVCDDSLLGMRDRAMLAVFYGCGVRRNEGTQLEVKDVLPDKNLLYIRKAKGGRQRYVPMIGKVKKDILQYVQIARPVLINNYSTDRFFIGIRGRPLGGQSLYERLRSLLKRAEIKKSVGLHSLRHSIATHLLSNGMALSEIAKLLGHRSLESTQIYTHLTAEALAKEVDN